jgi:flagellin-specific chaperone FliS
MSKYTANKEVFDRSTIETIPYQEFDDKIFNLLIFFEKLKNYPNYEDLQPISSALKILFFARNLGLEKAKHNIYKSQVDTVYELLIELMKPYNKPIFHSLLLPVVLEAIKLKELIDQNLNDKDLETPVE